MRAGSTAEPAKPRLELSPTQVIAAVAATLSAAVLCGALGVTGTLVGMAVMSATATTASAVYGHTLKRARQTLRRPAPGATLPGYTPARVHTTAARRQWQRQRRLGLLAGAGVTLGVSLIVLTAVEAGFGESVARLWGHGGDAPSIIGGGTGEPPAPKPVSPAVSSGPTDVPNPSSAAPQSPASGSTSSTPVATPTPTSSTPRTVTASSPVPSGSTTPAKSSAPPAVQFVVPTAPSSAPATSTAASPAAPPPTDSPG